MEGNGGTATPAWDLGMHWAPAAGSGYPPDPSFAPRAGGGGGPSRHDNHQQQERQAAWLNLGKRPCWTAGWQPGWDNGGTAGGTAAAESKRKEKAAAAAVPRCVVEGCHVSLAGSKEYHRRHKVCEAHSKAPRVVVLGTEQRFCQQCSRFHAISEFDDTKRSCRRRLAGHNERRRKSNASEAMARSAGHPHGVIMPFLHGGFPSSQAGALSLLSSARGGAPWLIPAAADISARSSAALEELIAENRAALLAWQYFSDRSSPATSRVPLSSSPPPTGREVPFGWHTTTPPQQLQDRFEAGQTTLDLMQTPGGAPSAGALFRPVPERPPKNDGDSSVA